MNKTMILETAFETINESLEWGFECEKNEYENYINGVVDITNKLLDKIAVPTPEKNTDHAF